MAYKPVDTAIVVVVGPVIDNTDFKSLETAIAYDAAGMSLDWIQEKTDGTTVKTDLTLTTGGNNDWTHLGNGYYSVEITAAQNNEEGVGWVGGLCTGVLAFESPHYDIVPTAIYDALIKGTGNFPANMKALSDDATAADNLEAQYDGTGLTGANFPERQKDGSRILDRIEYNRGHHTVTGATFYVDGVSGNDGTGDGSRALPFKTISRALTAATTNAHDEIILLPNPAGGPTTITEAATIVVTKNYVQIRGPGRDVNVTLSGNGTVFDIQANGVELSGFRVTTFGGASSTGVLVNNAVDFVRLYRLWIENAHQDAIRINVANRCEVANCVIVAPGRDGFRVDSGAGSGTYNVVIDSVIRDAVGSAVNLQGSDASDCRIQRNIIRDNAVGVTIAAGVVDTVFTDNRLINNTTPISDAGTRTLSQWNYLSTDNNGLVLLQAAQTFNMTGSITGNLSGSVGSVTGAVGSVTGNVGGNVAGSVGSVTGAVGSVTGSVGSVTGAVGSVTGAVGSVVAAVTVGTNNDKAGYALTSAYDAAKTAAPTVTQIRTEMDTNSTKLANLDAAISTRLATAGYTAPDNAGIAANGTAITNTHLAVVSNAATIIGDVGNVQIVTDKLGTAVELDGAVYRFTTNALEQAPSGGAAPTAATIADAVWDEAIAGHLAGGSTGAALNGAGAAGDPWTAALPGAYVAGTAGYLVGNQLCKLGSGAITWTYTLTSGVDATPIADADVWVTTDAGGTNTVAAGRTNAFGVVTFYLDAGTYRIWRQKSGWTFTNPDVEVVV